MKLSEFYNRLTQLIKDDPQCSDYDVLFNDSNGQFAHDVVIGKELISTDKSNPHYVDDVTVILENYKTFEKSQYQPGILFQLLDAKKCEEVTNFLNETLKGSQNES